MLQNGKIVGTKLFAPPSRQGKTPLAIILTRAHRPVVSMMAKGSIVA